MLGHIVLPLASSAVLVHVDKLTSTLIVHVEVTNPPHILHGFHGSLPQPGCTDDGDLGKD